VLTPLYEERQVLIAGDDLVPGAATIGWPEVLELPICLLHKGMRGRQLIDEALAARGLTVTPQLETDSVVALLAHVGTGRWVGIVPHTWLRMLPPPAGARVLRLDNPPVTARVVLVTQGAEPGSVLTHALLRTVEDVDFAAITADRTP